MEYKFIYLSGVLGMVCFLNIATYEWVSDYYVRLVNTRAEWFGYFALFGYFLGCIAGAIVLYIFN